MVIGIDLGTRYSCASIWRHNRAEIICDSFGNTSFPSIVTFYGSAQLVGHNAQAMMDINPVNTIYDIKRILGRKFQDESVQQFRKLLTYQIQDDETAHHNILVTVDQTTYRPEEICAQILLEIKKMAIKQIGSEVQDAVITVPAYFNDAQRQATLDAGQIAGFDK